MIDHEWFVMIMDIDSYRIGRVGCGLVLPEAPGGWSC